MNLTDILLIVLIVLLLLLFVAVPVMNYFNRTRERKPRAPAKGAMPAASGHAAEEKPRDTPGNGHDLDGGARVEEPAAALESGYRRVDPSQDIPLPQGKKNGKPH